MAMGSMIRDVQATMRELVGSLGRLNSAVAVHVQLRTDDLEMLHIISRQGPVTASELAQQTGVHPATLTGVLDRLERGGWITRRRDAVDRRKVVLEGVEERMPDLVRLFGPMSRSIAQICSDYSPEELAVIKDFLTRATAAGEQAVSGVRDIPRS